jgi:hypothetical protein
MGAKKQETKQGKKKQKEIKQQEGTQEPIPVCNYAPEWAEHARFNREDEPCDDGRMGGRPCAEDESCPVTEGGQSEDVENL